MVLDSISLHIYVKTKRYFFKLFSFYKQTHTRSKEQTSPIFKEISEKGDLLSLYSVNQINARLPIYTLSKLAMLVRLKLEQTRADALIFNSG